MAIMKSNLLGTISGRIGDVVYRNVNGRTIVCSRPVRKNKQADDYTIMRRLKFKNTGSFVKSAMKLKYVKEEWKKKAENMTSYNAMFKANYNNITHDDVSDLVTIFPDKRVGAIYDVRKDDRTGFGLKLQLKETLKHETIRPKYVQMGVVIFCSEPVNKSIDEILYLHHDSKVLDTEGKDEIDFVLDFVEIGDGEKLFDVQLNEFGQYRECKVFVVFTFLNEEMEMVGCSNTVVVK